MLHINLYLQDRAYAGPEEGGRYVDVGTFKQCLGKTIDPEAARIIRDSHEPRINEMNRGRRPISSVSSTGRYAVLIEPCAGEDYPAFFPPYE